MFHLWSLIGSARSFSTRSATKIRLVSADSAFIHLRRENPFRTLVRNGLINSQSANSQPRKLFTLILLRLIRNVRSRYFLRGIINTRDLCPQIIVLSSSRFSMLPPSPSFACISFFLFHRFFSTLMVSFREKVI